MLGQKLRLPGGHIYLHRALGLAGFATDQRSRAWWTASLWKTLLAQRAGEHLPQQARRGRGWNAALRRWPDSWGTSRARGVAACAYAHAALGSARKRALVGDKCE